MRVILLFLVLLAAMFANANQPCDRLQTLWDQWKDNTDPVYQSLKKQISDGLKRHGCEGHP